MSDKKTNFILHDDYVDFLDGLSDEEFGKLIRVISTYNRTGELPNLPISLSIAFNFIRKRVDDERTKWEEAKESRTEAAKTAANARWDKYYASRIERIDENASRIERNADYANAENRNAIYASDAVSVSVSVSESVSESDNNKYSSPSDDGGPTDLPPDQDDAEKRKEQKGERKQRAKENEERFSRFWAVYPKREDKKNAIRAWNKLNVTDQMLDDILSALEKQKASAQWNDRKYIPHPSTWLNGERWKDETEPITGAPPGNNPPEKTQNRKGRHELDPNKNYDFVDEELLALIESMEAE